MAMLKSYSLSSKKKKDYTIKFKVDKGVKVTFTQVGDTNQVHLNYDSNETGERYRRNYVVTGPLKLQFFQHESLGKGDKGGTTLDPDINIEP